ncbi:hypothetical protein ES702_02571 [subsurface metagenome]
MNTRKQHYAMTDKIAMLKLIRAKLEQAEKANDVKAIELYRLTENDVLAQIGKMYLEMRGVES